MRATLSFRLARSAAFSAVCVLLAVGAHRFAGGGGPTPAALLTGVFTVAAGAAVAAGRERSPQAIAGLLVAAQAFLHWLLDASSSTAVVHPTWHSGLSAQTGMLTAHLTATLITGWWLSRGEEALWSVLRGIGAGVVRCLRALVVLVRTLLALWGANLTDAGRPLRCAAPGTECLPRTVGVLRHAVIRRGPPVLHVL